MTSEQIGAVPSTKLKLLIADDDTPTRILLRAAILQWGYEVIEAKDGEEAWQILQQPDAPRLLIFDWLMPKLDGIALCQRCKTELNYHPYIILLTQVSGTTNLLKGLEAGADEFLSKPFNMAELRSRLSIGSRIIQYDTELSHQNIKMQSYIKQMEMLNHQVMSLAEQCLALKIATPEAEKMMLLQTHMEKIVGLIAAFQATNVTGSANK